MRSDIQATYILAILGLIALLLESVLTCEVLATGALAFSVVCLIGSLWNGIASLRRH